MLFPNQVACLLSRHRPTGDWRYPPAILPAVSSPAEYETELREIMFSSAERCDVLRAVVAHDLPDCWLAAGFVRNTVWDRLHGYRKLTPLNDVDVAYFDRENIDRDFESAVATALQVQFPELAFSVKNQARMHVKNHHAPYRSATDAISRWTETCTAVGVRWGAGLEICAPHGLADLFGLVVRPTCGEKEYLDLVCYRIRQRQWLTHWPRLRVDLTPPGERGSP